LWTNDELREAYQENRAYKGTQYAPDNSFAYSVIDGNQWIGYDDENTLVTKMRFAQEQCLGGIMVWAMDYDVKSQIVQKAYRRVMTSEVGSDQANNGKVSNLKPSTSMPDDSTANAPLVKNAEKAEQSAPSKVEQENSESIALLKPNSSLTPTASPIPEVSPGVEISNPTVSSSSNTETSVAKAKETPSQTAEDQALIDWVQGSITAILFA
jgi:hypothetical protein